MYRGMFDGDCKIGELEMEKRGRGEDTQKYPSIWLKKQEYIQRDRHSSEV